MSNYDEMQKKSKEHVDNMVKSFSAMSRGMQSLAVENSDFAKKSFEHGSSALEQMMSAGSMEKFFEIQSDFIKSHTEQAVSQIQKNSEICISMIKDAYSPYEGYMQNAMNTVQKAANQASSSAKKAAA